MSSKQAILAVSLGALFGVAIPLGLSALDHLLHLNEIEMLQKAEADTIVEGLEGPRLDPKDVLCLALNTYHEARGESTGGRYATMNVVMNRVEDGRWPDTVCEVVQQAHLTEDGKIAHGKCAFSWYCDGKEDIPSNNEEFDVIYNQAQKFLENPNRVDITDGAVYYHSVSVFPGWRIGLTKTARIDGHFFYR